MREGFYDSNPEITSINSEDSKTKPETLEVSADSMPADIKEITQKIIHESFVTTVLARSEKELEASLKELKLTDVEIDHRLADFRSRVGAKVEAAQKNEFEVISDGEKIADAAFKVLSTAGSIMKKGGFWKKFAKYIRPDKINAFDDVREIYERVNDEEIRKSAYWSGHLDDMGNDLVQSSYLTAALGLAIGVGCAALTKDFGGSSIVTLGIGMMAAAEVVTGSIMKIIGQGRKKTLLRGVRNYPRMYDSPDFGKFKLPGITFQFYAFGKSRYDNR